MWVRRKKHRYLHYSISKMSQVPDGNGKGCDFTRLDYVIRSLSKVPDRNGRG